jgi:hypothetical protein
MEQTEHLMSQSILSRTISDVLETLRQEKKNKSKDLPETNF